jgi:group I intron endonuclease
METKLHHLYVITNVLTNKIYIGQSAEPYRRWSTHKRLAKTPEETGQYIHRAMDKYGVENFIFEIIATCNTLNNADETEAILIEQYKSRDKDFGYNLKAGGNSSAHSEETKEKLRAATIKQIETKGHPAKGIKWTEEQRNNLSASLKALDKTKIYTDEVKQRMSEAHLGHKQPEEQIEKRRQSIKEVIEKRHEEALALGSIKCHAPDCDIKGFKDINEVEVGYLIVNGERYCSKHGSRLKRNGTLEKVPLSMYKKRGPISEETRKKLLGRVPHNRINFSEEQISAILSDERSLKKIAKNFGVDKSVIKRIKEEAGNKKAA